MGHAYAKQEKAYYSTIFRAKQEKRYNLNPVMVCGLNVDKMIQETLVSSHVCYHFVHEADVPPRTCKDVHHTGIWPEHWDPKEMLGNMNDGHSIFKGNSMTVLTPLETTGTSAGLPIEVPQGIRMIAFIDLKVLVTTGEAVCYFAASGQLLTSSAIPTGAISMITD